MVAEIPASGPRLGRVPAVTDGSGICPGIASDSVVTTARRRGRKGGGKVRWQLNHYKLEGGKHFTLYSYKLEEI